MPVFEKFMMRSGTLTLVGGDKGADASVTFKGDESGAKSHSIIDYITRENNDPTAVSYCISPFFKGAKENGTTTVKIDNALSPNDKKLIGIAIAGYPHNKYGIAGFNDLSEEDRYYATLIAMEHFVFQYPSEYKNAKNVKFNGEHWNATRWYPNPSLGKPQQQKAQKIIDLAKQIYQKGITNLYDETK